MGGLTLRDCYSLIHNSPDSTVERLMLTLILYSLLDLEPKAQERPFGEKLHDGLTGPAFNSVAHSF